MAPIVLISDLRVLQYPVSDCGEPLVDLADYAEFRLSSKRQKENPHFSKVRRGFAERLQRASKLLPTPLVFLIEDGFRSLVYQRKIYDECYEELKRKNLSWDSAKLQREVARYVANPAEAPPHCTGGAIDLSLLNQETQSELQFDATSDEMPEINECRGYTGATNISEEARKNRTVLIRALSSVDFVNYPTEWWHWSYGDRYWAYSRNEPYAVYDVLRKTF